VTIGPESDDGLGGSTVSQSERSLSLAGRSTIITGLAHRLTGAELVGVVRVGEGISLSLDARPSKLRALGLMGWIDIARSRKYLPGVKSVRRGESDTCRFLRGVVWEASGMDIL
jgi:hypothetical protein